MDREESKAHTAVRILLRLYYLCSNHSNWGSNLGFFIADNAGPNDTAIRPILRDLDQMSKTQMEGESDA